MVPSLEDPELAMSVCKLEKSPKHSVIPNPPEVEFE